MDAPDNKEEQPVLRDILAMHEQVLNDLLLELPHESKLIALQVLNKHQQKIANKYFDIDKPTDPAITELFETWLRIGLNAEKDEEARTTARRNVIRSLFKAHGFTVKPGETDLKEYVFRAAESLIRRIDVFYRKMGIVAITKTGDFDHNTVEHYQAMEDRSKWSTKQWIEHLGGRQDEQMNIVFGSPYAVAKLLELYCEEMVRGTIIKTIPKEE